MGVGRKGQGGSKPPLDFEIFRIKKIVFLVLSGKNQTSPLWSPLEKFKKNPLMPPPGKNPSDAHAYCT